MAYISAESSSQEMGLEINGWFNDDGVDFLLIRWNYNNGGILIVDWPTDELLTLADEIRAHAEAKRALETAIREEAPNAREGE